LFPSFGSNGVDGSKASTRVRLGGEKDAIDEAIPCSYPHPFDEATSAAQSSKGRLGFFFCAKKEICSFLAEKLISLLTGPRDASEAAHGKFLPPVPDADIQSKCLLTDSAFTAVHKLGDFGDRSLTLRMHLEIANVFFGPRNSLTASISCFGLHGHESVPSCFCNKRFVVLLDGEAWVNRLCSTIWYAAPRLVAAFLLYMWKKE
jgi:hypothetical protein